MLGRVNDMEEGENSWDQLSYKPELVCQAGLFFAYKN